MPPLNRVRPSSIERRSFVLAVLFVSLTVPRVLASQQPQPRTMSASRVSAGAPMIDGRLDDVAWLTAEIATDFIQREPATGKPATQRTTVSVVYDDAALYVAMRMFDTHPHLINAPLSRRDDADAPAEWVTVSIDSNLDRRTAFKFATTPRGVQYDAVFFEDSREDSNWDAVWEVATQIDSLGWTAEFRIPLSQLRYSLPASGDAGPWGIEFGRDVSRLSEVSHWAPITPGTNRVVSFFGNLTGLEGLAKTRRLEVMPYTLARLSRVPGSSANPFYRRNDLALEGGADIKYGLTPSLTLTATINPDFGQVEADPSVVNLGSFETFFAEKRPFFNEGAEIFRFTMSPELQAFYTRRIGRPPQRSMSVPAKGFVDMPETARILAAAKISGKTSKGWSLGVLHAVTGESSARIADSTGARSSEPIEPVSHYSVVRVVRDFRRGQSGIGAIGSSTLRQFDDAALDFLRSRSLMGGANGWHRFAENRYEARLLMLGTAVHGSEAALAATQRSSVHRFQRPDASHTEYDTTITDMAGWAAEGAFQKIAGDWYGGFTWGARSPGLELNDAGYNTYSDAWYLATGWNYRSFKPNRLTRNWSTGASIIPAWTFGGERFRSMGEYRLSAQFKNLWGMSLLSTRWQRSPSPWDLRGGPALMNAAYTDADLSVNTNRRNAVSGSLRVYSYYAEETAERRLTVSPGIIVRPSAAVSVSLTPSATWNRDEDQYIRTVTVNGRQHYLMGKLEQATASLTGRVAYTFTPELSLDVYLQPFISSGRYTTIREVTAPSAKKFNDRFSTLGSDRLSFDSSINRFSVDLQRDGLADFTFSNPNFSVRQFRANSVVRWQYRPGSTLFFVWSQARDNGLLASGLPVRRELGRLFSADPRNVFLLKMSYWMGH
ncbi:MAG: DUF5916 domain-containing protein [Gemmatimonadaceae bacterium]